MLKNYFIITFRNLVKHRRYALFNILGLAIGIACFVLLVGIVEYELSFDRFHEKHKNIYRVYEEVAYEGAGRSAASTPFPLADAFHETFPEQVVKSVRIFNYQIPLFFVEAEGKRYSESRFYFADSTFFDVFDYPLEQGDAESALDSGMSVIISAEKAAVYFPEEEDVLGKKIILQNEVELTITGVFAPQEAPSHFQFDFIAPMSMFSWRFHQRNKNNWEWNACWTYLLFESDSAFQHVKDRMWGFKALHYAEERREQYALQFQRLDEIHMYSDLEYELSNSANYPGNANYRYVYVFAALALLILFVASINFINLATARASLRGREVGIRKVVGASRLSLVAQFSLESLVISLLATYLALIFVEQILWLLGVSFSPELAVLLRKNTSLPLYTLMAGIAVSIISGVYPAWYLSRFKPIHVLRGAFRWGYQSRRFREFLVGLQFAISTLLLIGTLLSHIQLDFLRNSRLGFHKTNLLFVPIVHTDLSPKYEDFKSELLQSPAIKNVTGVSDILGRAYQNKQYRPEGVAGEKGYLMFPSLYVRPDFCKTLGIEIVAGRDFQSDYPISKKAREVLDAPTPEQKSPKIVQYADDTTAVLINRAMVDHLGWGNAEEAIGRTFSSPQGQEKVVGVVENFHFTPLREQVSPLVIDLPGAYSKLYNTKYLILHLEEGGEQEAIRNLTSTWQSYIPSQPLEHFFLNENLDTLYIEEERFGQVSMIFSIIAIFIGCMGLFGLASFVVARRRKEVGIRRALGAPTTEIVRMLLLRFLRPVWFGVVLGWVVTFLLANLWLDSFAYHAPLTVWPFLAATAVVVAITGLATSVQVFRAAQLPPIEAIMRSGES